MIGSNANPSINGQWRDIQCSGLSGWPNKKFLPICEKDIRK